MRIPNLFRAAATVPLYFLPFPFVAFTFVAAASGANAGEPTVGELLERIEHLEKSLAEVKRQAEEAASACESHAEAGASREPAGPAASGARSG